MRRNPHLIRIRKQTQDENCIESRSNNTPISPSKAITATDPENLPEGESIKISQATLNRTEEKYAPRLLMAAGKISEIRLNW